MSSGSPRNSSAVSQFAKSVVNGQTKLESEPSVGKESNLPAIEKITGQSEAELLAKLELQNR